MDKKDEEEFEKDQEIYVVYPEPVEGMPGIVCVGQTIIQRDAIKEKI